MEEEEKGQEQPSIAQNKVTFANQGNQQLHSPSRHHEDFDEQITSLTSP
jgi:hypothetical protein